MSERFDDEYPFALDRAVPSNMIADPRLLGRPLYRLAESRVVKERVAVVNEYGLAEDVAVEGDLGCCGFTASRANLFCREGHAVGRYASDCTTALETHFDLDEVTPIDDAHDDAPLLGHFHPSEPSAFLAWLHGLLEVDVWCGDNVLKLLAAWGAAPRASGVIVWSGAELDDGRTLEIVDDFTAVLHHAPALILEEPEAL